MKKNKLELWNFRDEERALKDHLVPLYAFVIRENVLSNQGVN